MVLSLATISSFYGSLPDSIRKQSGSISEYYHNFMAYVDSISVSDPAIGPEFTTGTKPQLDSKEQNRSQSQSQEDDESDAKNIYHEFNAQNTLVAANRPPSKPPIFTEDGGGEQQSLAHEIGCTTLGVEFGI
ncbi:hypothetical protein PIB30_089449 [Stylosanthes scabra]|uniref:Uncharacterized protein n=1 Tax=Stylosanthes scabra TaxID=79078 RepID=A0ABU6YRK5_9FABA|nr:hypothetical protein [Stylosanthes scabra]